MEACEILHIDCWESIFKHLDDDGLEALSLVSKDFLTISNISKDSLQVVRPRVGMLSRQLNRFKYLKNIYLIMLSSDLDKAIFEIACSLVSRLEALHIWDQCKFKTESLEVLGSNPKMKNLKVLHCWLKGLHDNDLVVIANSFPNLEELNFENLNSSPKTCLTDSGVEILASKLKLLKKIRIVGKNFLSDRSVVALASNCVFLQDVTLTCYRNHGMTENGIGLLLRNRSLVSLSIRGIQMDSSESTITIQNSISHAKALTSLEFSWMDVSDMLLNSIAKAKLQLKKFKLSFCKNFTVTGLLMVLSNSQLTKLSIVGTNLVDVDVELILNSDEGNVTHIKISKSQVKNSTLFLLSMKCPSLVEIRMNQTALDGQVNNGYNHIPLYRNPTVQNLYLKYSKISDDSAKQFGLIFPDLKVLELNYCYEITSTGIEAILKSCKFIEKLILRGNLKAIEADNSEHGEVNLEDLTLSNSLIDDEELAAIAMKCCRLVSLTLSYCSNVTMEGIKQIIKNIRTLKCLCMLGDEHINLGDLLEWMLFTGNLASLEKISIGKNYDFSEEQRDELLQHGCLITKRDFSEYP